MALWKDKVRQDWIYEFEYQGNRYGGRGFKTKKEAEEAKVARRKEIKSTPEKQGMAYSEAVNLYLDHAERAFATKTYKGKVYAYECFAKYLKHDLILGEITTQMIDLYLKIKPTNNNYNVHKKDLSALFTYAKEILEVIDRHPIKKIKNLPHTKKQKYIPKEADIIKLILAADPKTDERDLLIVLLHTLARIDEALRLTWADVNFEKKILTKWTKKNKDRSYKAVPVQMNDELYTTLWKMWGNKKQEQWVFYNEKSNDRYYHRPKFMIGLCKRAEIKPYFTFHTLRHLMASLLADNPKISTNTIQKILGHSEARTTEIYLHELDGAQQNAMDSLSGRFDQKEPEKIQTPTKNPYQQN